MLVEQTTHLCICNVSANSEHKMLRYFPWPALSCHRYLTGGVAEYETGGSRDPDYEQWTTATDRTIAY